jgi:flavodoxin
MKSAVIYDSQYGNTQQLAEVIATELEAAGPVQIANARGGSINLPTDLALLVVGGPTQVHQLTPQLRTQLDAIGSHYVDGLPVATFDTRGRGPRFLTGAASRGIARRLERKGAQLVLEPESFLVLGTAGPLVEGELDRARSWAREILTRVAPQAADVAVA